MHFKLGKSIILIPNASFDGDVRLVAEVTVGLVNMQIKVATPWNIF